MKHTKVFTTCVVRNNRKMIGTVFGQKRDVARLSHKQTSKNKEIKRYQETRPQPCHGASCGAPLLGRISCSRWHGIRIRRCCGRFRIWGGLGALVHIAGRGHIAIPTHPVPYH